MFDDVKTLFIAIIRQKRPFAGDILRYAYGGANAYKQSAWHVKTDMKTFYI